ncbi:MAG: DUF4270 family protein [Chitinophagaceae bacterium]|nr:MAG: DUF4270 family protein [Chitinophagaceae bacterium]
MKKLYWLLLPAALFLTLSLGIQSCRKINEATELGGGLVPAVDNINTFETYLDVETDNGRWNGNTTTSPTDLVVLGAINNDPEFGSTTADVYFNYGPSRYGVGTYPYFKRDSVQIDSVVLQLAYVGGYGDTNAPLNVQVREVRFPSNFRDSSVYTTQEAPFGVEATVLANSNFVMSQLDDTLTLIRKRDTTKVANVVRLRLANILGDNLVSDSTAHVDYKSFYALHPGIAILANAGSGNGLAYFNLLDSSRTKLMVYYRKQRNGVIDTTSYTYYHGLYGGGYRSTYSADTVTIKPRGATANLIHRTPGGNWLTYLNAPGTNEDKVYMQSEPGSAAYLRIPGLDTMQNKVIHRAELIASVLPSASNNFFKEPPALYLGRRSGDSILQIRDDSLSAVLGNNGAVNSNIFGGDLKSDNTYRFNITLHVQQVLLRNAPNDQLKLFAPYKLRVADARFGTGRDAGRTFYRLPQIAYGRVVLGGGSNADPNTRMRLRIVYSRLP